MTFGEIKQRVYDKLGLTGETTMVESMVNETLLEVSSAPWRYLQETSAQTIGSDGIATTGTSVAYPIEVYGTDGLPLDVVSQELYEDLYRGDTATTATNPLVATLDGQTSVGGHTITVWPKPTADLSGSLRYCRRVSPMSTDVDVPDLPFQFHSLLVDGALARFAAHENDDMVQISEQRFNTGLERMRQTEPMVERP